MKNKSSARIALFQKKQIRRTLHQNEWWFVIADVVAALTDSSDPQGYLKDMRRRDPEIEKGWGQIATPLPVPTTGEENGAADDRLNPPRREKASDMGKEFRVFPVIGNVGAGPRARPQ